MNRKAAIVGCVLATVAAMIACEFAFSGLSRIVPHTILGALVCGTGIGLVLSVLYYFDHPTILGAAIVVPGMVLIAWQTLPNLFHLFDMSNTDIVIAFVIYTVLGISGAGGYLLGERLNAPAGKQE